MTWGTITSIEPRLLDLEHRARQARPNPGNYWDYYESLKTELRSLVGWNAAKPELRTEKAYSVAIDMIVKALDSGATG